MAKQIIEMLVDDLDGSEATQSLRFEFDGSCYEIDLSDKNAAKLREAMAPYQAAGVKVGRSPKPGAATRTGQRGAPTQRGAASSYRTVQLGPDGATSKAINAAVRAWADKLGLPVSDRGRIKQEIRDAYEGREGPAAAALLSAAYESVGVQPPAAEAQPATKAAKKAADAPPATFSAPGQRSTTKVTTRQ